MKTGCCAATILAITLSLAADARAGGGIKAEVNAGAVLPVGDLADVAATGFAVNAYLVFMITRRFGVEGHVGYHKFGAKEVVPGTEISGALIPLKVGIVKVWGPFRRIYTNASLGVYKGVGDFDETKFGMGPRVGYVIQLGGIKLDLGAEFHSVFSDPRSYYFGLNVGAIFDLGGGGDEE